MQKKLKKKIEKRFNTISFEKIILYKNPNEFSNMSIERVNPNHVGILWGNRKKKLNKGTHPIKFGKVYFNSLLLAIGLATASYIDAFTGYVFNILLNIGIVGIICIGIVTFSFYYIPFKIGGVCSC